MRGALLPLVGLLLAMAGQALLYWTNDARGGFGSLAMIMSLVGGIVFGFWLGKIVATVELATEDTAI